MKKIFLGIFLVLFCIIVSNIVIAQSSNANDTILTLTYRDEHRYYTLDDLLAFDSITGNGGRLKVTGDVIPPWEYTGVIISTLAQEFSDIPSEYCMQAIADDGYIVNYTFDEIQGEVMVYDNDGNEIGIGGVYMILATKENGQTGYDGSLRIAFINQDEPITFSALWAKYVVEIKFTSPPDKPTITGTTNGKAGTEYPFKISTKDPAGDDVYYCIDWDDGTDEICIGPYESVQEVNVTHTWTEKNTYTLRVKAKDEYGAESDWASIEVKMPKSKVTSSTLFFQSFFLRFPFFEKILKQ